MLPFCSWFQLMSLFETVIYDNLCWNTFLSSYHIDFPFNIYFSTASWCLIWIFTNFREDKAHLKIVRFCRYLNIQVWKFGILFSHVCAEEILLNKIFSSSSKLIEWDISVSLSFACFMKIELRCTYPYTNLIIKVNSQRISYVSEVSFYVSL